MKISMISTLPPIKGLSPYTLGLVKELSKSYEIDFYGFKKIYPEFLYPSVTKTKEKQPKINNVKVINNLTWYNPFSWIKTGFQIKTEIVHAQWWSWFLAPVFYIILKIAKMRDKKIIMTIHNVKPHEKSLIKNWLNNSVINLADEYIVHNEKNKKIFLKVLNTPRKVNVIPHGIIEMKESKKSIYKLKKEYGFENTDKILLFFGNIRDYKGLDNLFESLYLLKDNSVKLIIAGKPWGSFQVYENLIKNLKLDNRIKLFLEFNSEAQIAELFKISDLAIFPYKEFEAASGAAAVAINYKKPMVVTSVGGLTDLVNDKKVIAKANNPKNLKEGIIYALNNLNRLAKDSEKKIKEFSWSNIAKKTINVYQNEKS